MKQDITNVYDTILKIEKDIDLYRYSDVKKSDIDLVILSIKKLQNIYSDLYKAILENSPIKNFQSNPRLMVKKITTLKEIFPHINLINLDSRPERLTIFKEHLKIIGEEDLPFNIIQGVDGYRLSKDVLSKMPNSDYSVLLNREDRGGRYGCFLSQLNAIVDAKMKKYPRVLILEDDSRFSPMSIQGNCLQDTFNELPDSWGILYLGFLEMDLEATTRYSENLVQPGCPYDLHGYVVNSTMYDRLITLLENELKKTNGTMRPVDVVVAEDVAVKHRSEKIVFGCLNNVMFQDESYSSIVGKTYSNYRKELDAYQVYVRDFYKNLLDGLKV